MPLLGQAAMLLSFDVADEAIAEHDDWHTLEHLPERLGIPGFLRGTRWVSRGAPPRYFVLYEVEQLATLTSPAYLDRLNHPSRWTTAIMARYRGMSRGFCRVAGSFGFGAGHACALVRFRPETGREEALRRWLLEACLPPLATAPGLGSAHLLEGAATPAMTNEQRIRGTDAPVDWAVIVGGYREDVLERLLRDGLDPDRLVRHGATAPVGGLYRLDYSLSQRELDV